MAKRQKLTSNTKRILGALGKKDLTKKEAQMVVNEARKQLVLRKTDFLRALERRIEVRETEFSLTIIIPGFAKLIGKLSPFEFKIYTIRVGDFFAKKHSLRGLGIASLILNRAITFAKKRKLTNITLSCSQELVSFYKQFGFKVISKSASSRDMILLL